MKTFFKTHYKKIIVLVLDVLCVIGVIVSGPVSEAMLQQTDKICMWDAMGIQCMTCGGTHFVNDLVSGRIGAAFMDNQFLFLVTLYLAVTMVFLNLFCLFDLAFAKKVLKCMYNLRALIVFGVVTVVYFIARNIPFITKVLQALQG